MLGPVFAWELVRAGRRRWHWWGRVLFVGLLLVFLYATFGDVTQFASGLQSHQVMAEIGARKSVAVSSIGKVKTAAQMAAIPMLLFHERLFGIDMYYWGQVFLWVAGVLTVWSMFYYLRRAWPLIKEKSGN